MSRFSFGDLPEDRRKKIARKGAKALHKQGKAHRWNKKTAKAAGVRGGINSAKARRKKRLAQQSKEKQSEQSEGTPPLPG